MSKIYFVLIVCLLCNTNPINAQFLDKLKETIENEAEETVKEVGELAEEIGKDKKEKESRDEENETIESERSPDASLSEADRGKDKNNSQQEESQNPKDSTKKHYRDEDAVNVASSPLHFFGANANVREIEMKEIYPSPSDSLVIIKGDLWHVGKNQIIAEDWATYMDSRGRTEYLQFIKRPVSKVHGATNVFFGHDGSSSAATYEHGESNSEFGILTKTGRLYTRGAEKSVWVPPRVPGESDEILFLSSDGRRVVFFRNDDIWRGEFDWNSGEIVNEMQVTQVGLFSAYSSGLASQRFSYWHDNALYVWGGFSETKPIVRVDLMTGKMNEIPFRGVFGASYGGFYSFQNSERFTNPSGSRLCRADEEILYCYDAEESSFFYLDIAHKGLRTHGILENSGMIISWLTDEVFAFASNRLELIGRIDLENRHVDTLFIMPDPGMPMELDLLATLPGGRWVELATPERGRFLLDLTNGSTIDLSLPEDAEGKWADDNNYIYPKRDGGLNVVGTWVYSRETDQNRKVSGVIPEPRNVLSFPEYNVLFFCSRSGSQAIYRADLSQNTSEKILDLTELKEKTGRNIQLYSIIQPVLEPPVDLGIDPDSSPAWSEDSGVAIPDTKIGSSAWKEDLETDISGLSGMERILIETDDLNAHQRNFVKKVYRDCRNKLMISGFYDPACLALTFWERNKQKFDQDKLHYSHFDLDDADYSHCVSTEHIMQYTADKIERTFGGRTDFSEERMMQIKQCVGERMVKAFMDYPSSNPRYWSDQVTDFYIECKKE